MTPTKQQIETARRMQELGLCQGSERIIVKYIGHSVRSRESVMKYLPLEEEPAEIIGPHATAAECWPEVLQISGDEKTAYDLMEIVAYQVSAFGVVDIDEAFRQALIHLKEQSC